jgi:hypothetical protein
MRRTASRTLNCSSEFSVIPLERFHLPPVNIRDAPQLFPEYRTVDRG